MKSQDIRLKFHELYIRLWNEFRKQPRDVFEFDFNMTGEEVRDVIFEYLYKIHSPMNFTITQNETNTKVFIKINKNSLTKDSRYFNDFNIFQFQTNE